MNLNDPANVFALRYATEATKVFLMDLYRQKFPHLFRNAVLETRPATSDDYFVPPSLADRCLVVEATRFDEEACRLLSCYPFKEDWEPCEEKDALRWIRIGDRFQLACQPTCRTHALYTEWTGECVLANPYKTLLASMPEKLFQRASRHAFHGGLDVKEGTLQFNARYCEAYGLDLVDGDCVASGGQSFGEWLLGKTPIRAAKTAGLAPLKPLPVPPLPNIPPIVEAAAVEAIHDLQARPIYQELAKELAEELGREVSEHMVEKFLKKKAPKLLTKAIDRLPLKLVLKHSVATSLRRLGTASLKMLGKVVGIYDLYEAGVSVLDMLDPYDYQKVLNKSQLDQIDRELDYAYYRDGMVRPALTPEYIWENEILLQDESEKISFMVDKVEEYLNALHAIPPNQYRQVAEKTAANLFVWEKEKKQNTYLVAGIVFAVFCFTLLLARWIHVWSCILFFVMIHFQKKLTG